MFMNTGAVVVLGGNDIEVKQYSNPYWAIEMYHLFLTFHQIKTF